MPGILFLGLQPLLGHTGDNRGPGSKPVGQQGVSSFSLECLCGCLGRSLQQIFWAPDVSWVIFSQGSSKHQLAHSGGMAVGLS